MRRLVIASASLLLFFMALVVGAANGAGAATLVIEAESATTNLPTETSWPGFTGSSYLCCWETHGEFVTFAFATDATTATLRLRYSAGNGVGTRKVELDGAVIAANQAFSATSTWATWSTLTISRTLAAGTHQLKVWVDTTAGSFNWINLDSLTVTTSTVAATTTAVATTTAPPTTAPPTTTVRATTTLAPTTTALATTTTRVTTTTASSSTTLPPTTTTGGSSASRVFEAETASTNIPTEGSWPGYTGSSYLCCWATQGQSVTFSFATASGATTLGLRYSAGNGAATRKIELDGVVIAANQLFAATSTWATWSTMNLKQNLAAGTHQLKVWFDGAAGSFNWINLDSLTVTGGAVAAAAVPVNTVAPAISGTHEVGSTLSVSTGSWTNSPTSFAYQWSRCNSVGASCVPMGGATQQSYVLTTADATWTVRATVAATSSGGSASADSASTTNIASGLGTSVQVIEAEAAATNIATEATWSGYSGSSYLCCWVSQGQFVTFSFTTGAGNATMALRYTAGNGAGTRKIELDGAITVANQSFPATSGWDAWSTVALTRNLTSGTHTLKVWVDTTVGSFNWINLDSLTVTAPSAGGTPPTNPSAPVNTALPTIAGHNGSWRVMALGDSITGYYIEALNSVVAANGASGSIQWVGSVTDNNLAGIPNEGHGGWCMDDLASHCSSTTVYNGLRENAPAWIANANPDVVLLEVGTNDFDCGGTPSFCTTTSVLSRFSQLLDTIYNAKPNAIVIVGSWHLENNVPGGACQCENLLKQTGFTGNADANAQLAAMIAGYAAANNRPVSFVDTWPAAPVTGATVDGLHPTNASVNAMANAWWTAMAPKLGGAPKVGQALTTTNGTWTNAPTSFAYQWQKCVGASCTDIGGATGPAYTPGAGDVGATLQLRVIATNAGGSTSATSAPSLSVVA
ncbi:MAG: carbohydrate-binding protein [Acidimicrobiia bacterium]